MLLENHNYKDPNLKVIYHTDCLRREEKVWLHFHQSPEFLCVLDGQISVTCNGMEQIYSPEEIVIINSNNTHLIKAITDVATYYCLIIDLSVCDMGQLPERSTDPKALEIYKAIMRELFKKESHYREAVIGYIKVLQSILARSAPERSVSDAETNKYHFLRTAINYMSQNYTEPLTLDDISNAIPLNKYYLSHICKELTGHSVLANLNYIRCNNALAMLTTGKYTVAECAYASGFSNLSHFSKMYKKALGKSPTEDLPQKRRKGRNP